MNKRLLFIYTTVFVLIGLMLHLYRSSYKDMKVFIQEVNTMSQVVIRLERLDALLHFWLNNDRTRDSAVDLYMSPDVAYDSILFSTNRLKNIVIYQEDRLRMDSIRAEVRNFQRLDEKRDTMLTEFEREAFRKRLNKMVRNTFVSANTKLHHRKVRLEESSALLDKWLNWLLILAGSLITIATFYSFNFLRQRKRAEGFNQTLLETTNNGIVSFDPLMENGIIKDFRVSYCNEAALKLLQLKNWKNVTLSDIIPAGIIADIRKTFDDVLKTGVTRTIEGYLQHDQERKWLYATVTPLHGGLLVSINNLTKDKSFQQKLTYKINQLKVTNEELQRYAYVTSHDLQEPLRKIQMFSDMGMNLDEVDTGKSKDDFFKKIQNIAGHMRDLIQTLLLFTRSTDKPEIIQKVDLNEVLNEVIRDLELREQKVTIDVPQLPVIEGSQIHLRLLFVNLLSNSLKFSKPDSRLTIRINERKVNQQDYVLLPVLDQFVAYTCISVQDNGVGFKSHLNEKVFTIFQRLHNKDNASGAGIGLAICRKIVNQHHGYMYAEAVENEGAAFHVFLPLEQPAETE